MLAQAEDEERQRGVERGSEERPMSSGGGCGFGGGDVGGSGGGGSRSAAAPGGGLPFAGIPPELQEGVDKLLAEEPDHGEPEAAVQLPQRPTTEQGT